MSELVRDWKAEKKDLEEAFDIIADKLVKADAEIERLKLELHNEKQYAADLITTLRCEAEDKDAEIERLKEDHQIVRNSLDAADAKLLRYETLITELRDALDITTQLLLVSELPEGVVENKISENMLLQQRAREETR